MATFSPLRLVILALLADEPNSGYGLGRSLAKERNHIWSANTQQIYAELAKLDSDGLLSVKTTKLQNRPAKKVYSLNRAGRAELRHFLIEEEPRSTMRDELLVHILAAQHAPQAVLSRLVERTRELEQRIAELKTRAAAVDRKNREALGLRITLDAALSRAQADMAWCERAIAALRMVEHSSL